MSSSWEAPPTAHSFCKAQNWCETEIRIQMESEIKADAAKDTFMLCQPIDIAVFVGKHHDFEYISSLNQNQLMHIRANQNSRCANLGWILT